MLCDVGFGFNSEFEGDLGSLEKKELCNKLSIVSVHFSVGCDTSGDNTQTGFYYKIIKIFLWTTFRDVLYEDNFIIFIII